METLHSRDTLYSADSVEWCPLTPYQHLFVCGTYQLSQESNRLGCLYLFSMDASANLVPQQTLDMPAILDTKWCHRRVRDRVLLGVANAKGDLLVYELSEGKESGESPRFKLSLMTKFNVCEKEDSGTLALSLDWSTGRFDDSEPCIAISDSRGIITLVRLQDDSCARLRTWKAHSFEAWITAFNYWSTFLIYSGGDDCRLHMLDSRYECEGPVLSSKAHEMGVTSIHCNADQENFLVTGSYDEKLRVWDPRWMKDPIKQAPLTGGVWRLKWDPRCWKSVLAACMHGGFCVVDCPSVTDRPNIVAEYKEHESLAYGSDWCHMPASQVRAMLKDSKVSIADDSDETYLIATCSFYDRKLCVSVYNTPQ